MGGSGGGGQSGGGGGGTSGAVSYPTYMETWHNAILGTGSSIESTLVMVMNDALGGSPFAGVSAYDPATNITNMGSAITTFSGYVAALASNTDNDAALAAANAKLLTLLGTSRTSVVRGALSTYNSLSANIVAKVQSTLEDFEAEVYTSSKARVDALMTAGQTKVGTDYATMLAALTTAINTAYDTSIANAADEITSHIADTTVSIAKNTAFEASVYTLAKSRIDALMTAGQSKVGTDYPAMMALISAGVNSAFDTVIANAISETEEHLTNTSYALTKNSTFEAAVYSLAKNRVDALMTAGKTTVNTDYASVIAAMVTAINSAFDSVIENAQTEVDAHVATTDYVTGKSTAFGTLIRNDLDAKTYPSLEAGYRNINAVQASAFVIARALLEEDRTNAISKFSADLYFQLDRERSEIISKCVSDMLDKINASSGQAYGSVMEYVKENGRQLISELAQVYQVDQQKNEFASKATDAMMSVIGQGTNAAYAHELEYVKQVSQQMTQELGMVYQMDMQKDQIIARAAEGILEKISGSGAHAYGAVGKYVEETSRLLAAELTLLNQIYHTDTAAVYGNTTGEEDIIMKGTDTAAKSAVQMLLQKKEMERAIAAMSIEKERLAMIAENAQHEEDVRLDEANAKWDLDVFQHGANVLAGIAGGTHSTSSPSYGRSAGMNALGGALSGAAAGAMIGSAVPGIGTAVGAGVGALLGIGGSLMG